MRRYITPVIEMNLTGLTREQVKSIIGVEGFYNRKVIDCQIGNLKIKLAAVHLKEDYNSGNSQALNSTLELVQIIEVYKTEAELAAEKSVEDARRALESAEKALKKVKEGK